MSCAKCGINPCAKGFGIFCAPCGACEDCHSTLKTRGNKCVSCFNISLEKKNAEFEDKNSKKNVKKQRAPAAPKNPYAKDLHGFFAGPEEGICAKCGKTRDLHGYKPYSGLLGPKRNPKPSMFLWKLGQAPSLKEAQVLLQKVREVANRGQLVLGRWHLPERVDTRPDKGNPIVLLQNKGNYIFGLPLSQAEKDLLKSGTELPAGSWLITLSQIINHWEIRESLKPSILDISDISSLEIWSPSIQTIWSRTS